MSGSHDQLSFVWKLKVGSRFGSHMWWVENRVENRQTLITSPLHTCEFPPEGQAVQKTKCPLSKSPSLGYHGLKFSKEELAHVFMLSKALGHELYGVQTCAWLHLRWALPYSSKANCLRLYHTWPFTKLQAKRPAIYGKTPLTCTRDKRKNC